MISALGDFQLALSAADFTQEADENERYSHVELRRFRCYEHTAIVSYSRPFSDGKSKVPRLSMKQIRAELTEDQKKLHNRVIKLRNKLVAHSDAEMMNFAAKAEPIDIDKDRPFYAVIAQHDEGLQFYKWRDQLAFIDLIRKVSFCLYSTMSKIAQEEPGAFDMTVHFPEAYPPS